MIAPNKIYIQPDIEEDDFRVWLLSPFNDKSVCYIRKEALLEWANGMSKSVATLEEELSYRELIEHIKSL